MPEEFSCPHCEKKLRVPDNLLGRRVKCPACGNGFLAASEDTSSAPNDDEGDRPGRRRRVDDEEEEREETDDNEGDADGEEEERERPRRRRRKRRRKGRSTSNARVIAPGIAMVLLGILGFVMATFWLIRHINEGREPPAGYDPKLWVAGSWTGDILAFVWAFIVTSGGFSMIGRRLYIVAKIAAVFAMLPCHPCCVFGLAVGIWALVILNSPDGHKAFE